MKGDCEPEACAKMIGEIQYVLDFCCQPSMAAQENQLKASFYQITVALAIQCVGYGFHASSSSNALPPPQSHCPALQAASRFFASLAKAAAAAAQKLEVQSPLPTKAGCLLNLRRFTNPTCAAHNCAS